MVFVNFYCFLVRDYDSTCFCFQPLQTAKVELPFAIPPFYHFTIPFLSLIKLHPSYPKLAEEEASVLQAHAALLLDDLLHGLENVSGHGDVPAHVDVSTFLPQALVHRLRQMLAQYVLYVFLTGNKEG